MADLSVKLGELACKNPVLTASGTFGYGMEYDDFMDVSGLGGIIVKGTTLENREGNPYPRMAETASGMLNAVGLQNRGLKHFKEVIYPQIRRYNTHVIVNVNGNTLEEYAELASELDKLEDIPAIELNISCPNVKQGGMIFGTHCPSARQVTKEVRAVYHKHLMVKLSPNVTDITEFARAVEEEGADSVSLINTLLGMAIDPLSKQARLSTFTGGLSGPAIKPVALRMVWQVARAVKIPLVGLGGIMNALDVVEFLLAGATAVQVGTANFIDPQVSAKIIQELEAYLDQHGYASVTELIGALKSA